MYAYITRSGTLLFSTGVFPYSLKYAAVKPIIKRGDKKDISNYRPISF